MAEAAFSAREREVIELLVQGKSNKQIALALHLAGRTVEFHLSNIYAKLGVTSRTEAALKLSAPGLRESTGEAGAGDVRESAVEKNDQAADNGNKSFSLRRSSMKNLLYAIGATLLTTTLIVVVTMLAVPSRKAASVPSLPAGTESASPASPTIMLMPVSASTTTAEPASSTTTGLSTNDIAQFVGETSPDLTNIPAGTSFTKTWTFRNAGTTTWTTGYFLKLTGTSHPLEQTISLPEKIDLTQTVKPGETVDISINLQAPAADGTYSYHWQLQTPTGQIVSGDGYDIWVTFTIGDVAMNSSISLGNITLELVSVDKSANYTNVHICAKYPDTQDWNPNGVILTVGSVQASIESYSLDNAKSPSTGAALTAALLSASLPVRTPSVVNLSA